MMDIGLLKSMLIQRAATFEAEEKVADDRFSRGFYDGKGEQARQTLEAIRALEAGSVQAAVDALNGDT